MKNKRNYYRILHVQPDAPVELIKMSYRTIMQKLKKHPDLGGDEWDASVINEAYAVLSDKKLRAAYDARLLRERTMADAGQQSEDQRGGSSHESKAEKETGADAKPEPEPEPQAEQKNSAQQNARRSHSANDEQTPANRCFFCNTAYSVRPGVDSDCVQCASPLLTLNPAAMEQSGNRSIQRQPRNSPLDVWPFWPGEKQHAVLADLSLHGLKLRFTHPLHAGHVIKVESPAFSGVARIAHCVSADSGSSSSGFLIGAQFLSVRFVSQSGTFVQTSA